MHTEKTTYTVAKLVQEMGDSELVVNRDYQRTPRVWPVSAQSYLVDTLLHGYPIPNLTLWQKTIGEVDFRVVTEIVDGQQRATAIRSYYLGEFKLTTDGDYKGLRYPELDADTRRRFAQYSVGADLVINATEDEVRDIYGRMNSFTSPLNGQEKRYAEFQGPFKWFVVSLADEFAQALKRIGALGDRQIARMGDQELLAHVIYGLVNGIITSSPAKLRSLYKQFNNQFEQEAAIHEAISAGLDVVLSLREIHGTGLVRSEVFITVLWAIIHAISPVAALSPVAQSRPLRSRELMARNLLDLQAFMEREEDEDVPEELAPFARAVKEGRNTVTSRSIRFRQFLDAVAG